MRSNKYVWLGTRKAFDAFTFIFEETEHGWIWAHAYRFDADTSTFIVECDEATWRALGFDQMSRADGIAACEMLFERHLDGQRLMSNAAHLRGSAWLNFPRVACERWYHGNVVLLGDAAHTALFSVGSGTKLALEDAIGLADALHAQDDLGDALPALSGGPPDRVGDGATSEGDTHEALNFAAVWAAPVVFFVQNNGYAISVPLAKQTAAPALAYKGVGYGMRSLRMTETTPPPSMPRSAPRSPARPLDGGRRSSRPLPTASRRTPMLMTRSNT